MASKQMMLSDVPKDIISKWNNIPVNISDLRELTETIIIRPSHLITNINNIEDQINVIITISKERPDVNEMTLEQYAYSFLYFDSKEMRDIKNIIYDYYEKNLFK